MSGLQMHEGDQEGGHSGGSQSSSSIERALLTADFLGFIDLGLHSFVEAEPSEACKATIAARIFGQTK
jgi:hypothetical protein